jgi:hypothetical protein
VMMQGLPPRGGVRKKHGSNVRVEWTRTGYKAPVPDERTTYREVYIHQGAKRRFGDCAQKTTELTPGDLLRVR